MSCCRSTRVVDCRAVSAAARAGPGPGVPAAALAGLLLAMAGAGAVTRDGAPWPPLPEIRPMPGMETRWAARRIRLNGVPMSIRLFTVASPVEEVVAYYQRLWKGRGEIVVEVAGAGERIVGHGDRGHYFTVQVRPAPAGAEGSLVVTAMDAPAAARTSFPLRRGSRVLSRMESWDAGLLAETLQIRAQHSVASMVSWYRRTLGSRGWKEQLDRTAGPGRVLELQRGGELLQMVVSPPADRAGGAEITVNWTKGP